MKRTLKFALLGLFFINTWGAYSQSIEENLQTAIESIYAENPTSVGIMVHVESPEQGISWSGAVGYSNKNTNTIL